MVILKVNDRVFCPRMGAETYTIIDEDAYHFTLRADNGTTAIFYKAHCYPLSPRARLANRANTALEKAKVAETIGRSNRHGKGKR